METADRQKIEDDIRTILANESQAIVLSEKLFSPEGHFSRLASSADERRALVRSPLFRQAQQRFRELQYQEAAAFARAVPQVPEGCVVKIEKANR